MKRILLISYNFSPESTGIGKYNGEMIEWLVKKGYDCSVLTAYPYYPFWKVQEPYVNRRFFYSLEERCDQKSGGKLRVHRCPIYVPLKPSGLKRIMLDFSFFLTAFFRLLYLLPGKKFDFVMAIAPSFQIGLLGIFYKKLRGSKLLYHIQDLQIEAARELQLIRSEAVIHSLFKIEKLIFNHSDLVSSISEAMVGKVERKAGKDIFLFPNWADVKQFFPMQNRPSLKKELGFKESAQVILYSGSIGEKQGLESILYAADAHRHHKDLKFVICGSGPYKEKLVDLTKKLDLTNVVFFPLQPANKFNHFLNVADIHLVIQKANASDLVMPSKLTTILAVGGLALITANSGTGLHSFVRKYDMGFLVDAENQEALNAGIGKVLSKAYSPEIKRNARRYAENHLAIDEIMNRFERNLKTLSLEKPHASQSIRKFKQAAGMAAWD